MNERRNKPMPGRSTDAQPHDQRVGRLARLSAPRVLTRAELPARIRAILVPVDFTEGARAALRWAAELATQATEIVLLHVIDPVLFGRTTRLDEEFADAAIVQDCLGRLREWRRTSLAPSTPVRLLVRRGPVDAEILRAISEVRPDLLTLAVQGTVDEPGADESSGYVARSIMRQTSCPVWIVPTDR